MAVISTKAAARAFVEVERRVSRPEVLVSSLDSPLILIRPTLISKTTLLLSATMAVCPDACLSRRS